MRAIPPVGSSSPAATITIRTPRRRRDLTEADRAAWAAYARTLRVMDGRSAPPEPQAAAPDGSALDGSAPHGRERTAPPGALPSMQSSSFRPALPPVEVGTARQPGLDAGTLTRFRTGKLAPARTLDLHGRTAQRAFALLHGFLRGAHADRVRCVEIITGRGSGPEGGVIRRELPLWLNLPELRPLILAAAHPHPANPGSVRVLLRRIRP